jgi:methyltransferase
MVSSVALYVGLVALIGLERLVEMRLSARNARRAFARGGIEYGARHFRWMSLMHAAFLIACIWEVILLRRVFVPLVGVPALAVVVVAQGLRYWAIAALGDRWNVRVIVVPGAMAVRRGPYRFLRHPNYAAVVLEMAALPLVHGAYLTAIVFSIMNALVLTVRIRCEERALMRHCFYAEQFFRSARRRPTRQRLGAS